MPTTTRRGLIVAGGALAASAASGIPARGEALPTIKWRLQSSFPKSFEIVWDAGEVLAREVAAMTDGRFQIALSPATGLDETSGALDAVAAGKVEIGHTSLTYVRSKDPTLALASAMPFGLNARLMAAFLGEQGGLTLVNSSLASHNSIALAGGNTGAAMAGWFHREIAKPDDLKGLKFRTSGLSVDVMKALGATPVTLAAGDIRNALEQREIDAAELLGPFDDDAAGLWRAARYYYYPGWWSGGTQLYFVVSKASHAALPQAYRSILAAAAAIADRHVLARYDAVNITALRRLAAGGAELKAFPEPVLDAAFKASTEVLDAIATDNAPFKVLLTALRKARADGYLWHQVAEHAHDTYLMVMQRKGRL